MNREERERLPCSSFDLYKAVWGVLEIEWIDDGIDFFTDLLW